jgi:nucleotide-binding universal stress UspA family protein
MIPAVQSVAQPLALPQSEAGLSRLRRILVPVDGSAFSEYALACAVELAHRADAVIDLAFVNVLPPSIVLGDIALAGQWERNANSHAEDYLAGLQAHLHARDTTRIETVVVRDTSAARALVRVARARGAGLTVMATHRRSGAARLWLGSVAEAFVRESPAPVLLVRRRETADPTVRADRLFERVVVALDGSRNADTALDEAALVAGLGGGALELLRIVDPIAIAAGRDEEIEAERRQAAAYLERRARRLRAAGLRASATVVVHTAPALAIVEHADAADADLVVVGTRGRKGLGRVLMGSVAEAVLRGTSRPVLVVPSSFQTSAGA